MVISRDGRGRQGGEAVLSQTDMPDGAPLRRVLRFGEQVRGDTIASIPAHLRTGPGSPSGRLASAALLPVEQRAWLSLSRRGPWPWQTRVRTIPLSSHQPAEPPQDALTLRDGMRVECHDGYVGRLEGLTVDTSGGRVLDLLLHVRGDVLAEVELPSSPFAKLLPLAGRTVLISPAWVESAPPEKEGGPIGANEPVVHINASPEQIGAGMVIRSDGDLTTDIWRLLEENPAIAPYLERITVVVRDGDVTLFGVVPSPRHKLTVEQDVWHVPGVFSVTNNLRVGV